MLKWTSQQMERKTRWPCKSRWQPQNREQLNETQDRKNVNHKNHWNEEQNYKPIEATSRKTSRPRENESGLTHNNRQTWREHTDWISDQKHNQQTLQRTKWSQRQKKRQSKKTEKIKWRTKLCSRYKEQPGEPTNRKSKQTITRHMKIRTR